MNCKDCFHYEICCLWSTEDLIESEHHKYCFGRFKDRNNIIELPFVAMVEQFLKDGKLDKKRTAHNGRYAVVYIDKKKWGIPLIDITEQFYNSEKAEERIQVLKELDNG